MENQNSLLIISKNVIIPGIIIAFIWQSFQILFFINAWAQPGITSWVLFLSQTTAVSLLLFFSFKSYRDQFNHKYILFGKCLQLGFFIGIAVSIFGALFFSIYTNSINPSYESWLHEMYLQSWTKRGLSEVEIQKQLATNDWLKTPYGMIYNSFFVIGLMTVFSIIPALLVSKSEYTNHPMNLS